MKENPPPCPCSNNHNKNNHNNTANGRVIWITGLSGAGKSTLAELLVQGLRQHNVNTVLLDGDELRAVLGAEAHGPANHSRQARLDLALRYSRLCALLANQGLTVVIATISLFHEVHRHNHKHLPRYVEVYLQVPMSELQRRDSKGLYRRFADGKIRDVYGLDLPVDEPKNPHFCFPYHPDRDAHSVAQTLLTALIDPAAGVVAP